MRGNKVFVDTNVLVYAYDLDAGDKRGIALEIMKDLWGTGLGVLSTQILQEFFVTVTKKISAPVDLSSARETIKRLSKWNMVIVNVETIIEATELQEKHKYSFWDSLVIAAALAGGAATVLSEDLADGHKIKGVTIRDPFKGTNPHS